MGVGRSSCLADLFSLQHYLQLCQMTSQEEPEDCSKSDSSVCWTLPRNFRLRTLESEGEDEAQEDTPMLLPREGHVEDSGKIEHCDKKLIRQHTISNPGYGMLMKRLKSSQNKAVENEILELTKRQSEYIENKDPRLKGRSDNENLNGIISNLSSGYMYRTMTEPKPIPDTPNLIADIEY